MGQAGILLDIPVKSKNESAQQDKKWVPPRNSHTKPCPDKPDDDFWEDFGLNILNVNNIKFATWQQQ